MASHWNHNTHFHPLALGTVSPNTRALDVGCGEGLLTRELRAAGAASVRGVDLSPEMVAQARERAGRDPGLEYRVADFLTMPVTEQFDLVRSHEARTHANTLRRAYNYSRQWDRIRDDAPGRVELERPTWVGAGRCPWVPVALDTLLVQADDTEGGR